MVKSIEKSFTIFIICLVSLQKNIQCMHCQNMNNQHPFLQVNLIRDRLKAAKCLFVDSCKILVGF